MLELYELNRVPPLSEVEVATGSGATRQAAAKVPASNGENTTTKSNSRTGGRSLRLEISKPGASKTGLESSANHVEQPASNHGRSNGYGSTEMKHRVEDEAKGNKHLEGKILQHKENLQEAQEMLRSRSGYGEEQESNVGRDETKEAGENVKHANRNPDHRDSKFGRPPQEVIEKIDRDKVKAALEKRRKASGYITKKTEVMDDDGLIERELEDGVELDAQSEKNKQDRRQNLSKPSVRSDNGNVLLGRHQDYVDEHHHGIKSMSSSEPRLISVEGEVSALDAIGPGLLSPKSGNRKREASTSPDRVPEERRHYRNNHFDYMEDRNQVQLGW